MLHIQPKDIPVGELHQYLLGAVGPRPIALASTLDKYGNPNLSPFSFFNVFSANPPIAIFSPARRVRNNTTKHTLENVLDNKEVVINVVSYDIVQQTSLSSTEYESGVNEFIKSGLTAVESELVKPFRVKESPVQMECVVNEVISLGQEGGAGNLVICEIKMLHINENILNDMGAIDPNKIDLVGRMGGNWYSRTDKKSMFEITKPMSSKGIGFDQIPNEILSSKFLSGNDLGKLAGIEFLPNETAVNDFKLIELSELFLELEEDPKKLEMSLHEKAKEFLAVNDLEAAWKTLLSFNN